MDDEKCSQAGCPYPRHRKGLCGMHYARWRKYKTTGQTGYRGIKAPLDERFIDRVQIYGPLPPKFPELGPCSIWTGSVHKSGYGTIGHNYKVLYVHRYAWERVNGEIPKGLQVDHRCLVKLCVRIDHLRLATNKQNQEHHSGEARRNSRSGVRDVFPNGNHWKVLVGHNGKQIYFGTYHTIEEAEQVAIAKRLELHTRNDVDRL